MTIPTISSASHSSMPFMQGDYQSQAIETFGKNLAESLKVRDGSWDKVMEAWDISLTVWKIIKESENDLCSLPQDISCETQVNDGLIFKTLKNWNNDKKKYHDEIRQGELFTPHGCIDLKFRNTESMRQFIKCLETKFYKQPLDSSIHDAVYSFALNPYKTANYKPSYHYDICGSNLKEEFGKNEYSRTEALNIYEILSQYSGITIKGQSIIC